MPVGGNTPGEKFSSGIIGAARYVLRYGNEIDHCQSLHQGGLPWDESNLQVLCRSCHIEKTRGENTRQPTLEQAAWLEFVKELSS